MQDTTYSTIKHQAIFLKKQFSFSILWTRHIRTIYSPLGVKLLCNYSCKYNASYTTRISLRVCRRCTYHVFLCLLCSNNDFRSDSQRVIAIRSVNLKTSLISLCSGATLKFSGTSWCLYREGHLYPVFTSFQDQALIYSLHLKRGIDTSF